MKFQSKLKHFHSRKLCILKLLFAKCWAALFRCQCVNASELNFADEVWHWAIFCRVRLNHPEFLHRCVCIWGQMTHICLSKIIIIAADNGLSPSRRQAIIWTNAGILLIGPLGINFSEISIAILTSSFKKMLLKVSSVKWGPFCLGLNVITH